ncbi:molecular chaperone [uncultured Parasphingopyxis sp.]|uniref:molecular chaperone n=1 Tax=uncultured Parasphingopyxis sp. TaxID=1547918 RepID=UPI002614391E|nr:molecular chaperone [uncultured Parasphingopyxis sp.]
MTSIRSSRLRGLAAGALLSVAALTATTASHANDLLVAPTRVVLDGNRGTEVILNNIGTEEADYRISLELRRMLPDGSLAEVETPNAAEQAALDMIRYAPRRVTLPPNQPQAIRIGARVPPELADGEYRVHMLFRAVPRPTPVTAETDDSAEGFSIRLIPIYGVTIPIIVRNGDLQVTAAISNPRIVRQDGRESLSFTLSRNGDRSTYGEIVVTKPGVDIPVVRARGIAAYAEIGERTVTLPVSEEYQGSLAGPVRIQYRAPESEGGGLIAELSATLQ